LAGVRKKLDSFRHVVDYYYRKAGIGMPQPANLDNRREWWGRELPPAAASQVATSENRGVLNQILLHLDCDDVDVFQLNDIRNLLSQDQTPQALGYAFVLQFCFVALRNGFRDRPTTGAMWAECQDPALMLDHLQGRVSDRKLRLFPVACCHRVPHLLSDRRSQMAVDLAERFAEGIAPGEEFEAVGARMRVREIRGHYGPVAAWAVAPSADLAARNVAWNAFCDREGMGEERHQASLLRCISGNPFCPVEFSASWRTDTTVTLAGQMYESRDFSAMPILADALQDAGCDCAEILDHCRDANAAHVRGCWVVDLLLGKS
jgi:hypothetical protein